jgi:hypothetical protein
MTKVRPSLFVRMWAYFCTNIKLHACTRVRTEALQYCHPGAIRPIMGLFAVSTYVRTYSRGWFFTHLGFLGADSL